MGLHWYATLKYQWPMDEHDFFIFFQIQQSFGKTFDLYQNYQKSDVYKLFWKVFQKARFFSTVFHTSTANEFTFQFCPAVDGIQQSGTYIITVIKSKLMQVVDAKNRNIQQ